jgi:NAD(P)-dependent dehydrogenase (short-subunit alcohol dehydrogenase family)
MSAERIALVTGASRGLGFATARALAAEGYRVWALARTQGGLEELDDAIAGDGNARPTLLPLDVTDTPALERMAEAIHARHGHLDVLVHCAIHAPRLSPVVHIDSKGLEKSFRINALAAQQLLRVTDPLLLAAPSGRAVFMTDSFGDKALWSPYHASKEAGIAFAKAYGQERAKTPVRAILHRPPPMPTATRALFYPSEPREKLTPCAEVAQEVVSLIRATAPT